MKKTFQYLLTITFIILNSCGPDNPIDEIESTISINTSTNTINFNDAEVNTSTELTFNISNTGNTDISSAIITNTNNVFVVTPSSFSLNKSQSKTFTVSFTPTQSQNYTDTFILKNGQNTLASVNVSGKGIITTPITSIASNMSSINFSNTTINTTKQLSIIISNTGNQNIQSITTSNNSSRFTVNPNSFSLNSATSKTISINFNPTQVQNYNDIITFTVNNNISINVNVSGSGIEQEPLTTYNDNIKIIMTNNCTSCHGSSGGVSLGSYTQTKNAFMNNGALQEIESGRMPQGPTKLSQTSIDLIKKWIADGYPE